MPRKPHDDFETRRKEQDRQAKKDATRAERQLRRDERRDDDAPAPTDGDPSTQATNVESIAPTPSAP